MSAPDPATATASALLHDVLAHAGRCLAVSSWPAPSPPVGTPDVPTIEVQAGDDGAPSVFCFATVVADDGPCQAPLEIRRGDVDDDDVAVGDEVGIELPLPRVAALAWALLSVQIERGDDDDFVPLPSTLWAALRDSGRLDAVLHGLAALVERLGAPPTPALSWLIRLASLDQRRCRAAVRIDDDGAGSLLVLAVDDGTARVAVIPGVTGRLSTRALVDALPPPAPATATALWHQLARPACWGGPVTEGPLRGEVVAVDVTGADVVVTLRVALLEDIDGERREIDAREARCTLPAPPLLLQAAVDEDGVARATASASRVLRRSLAAAAELRLAPERILHGSAWARVVARAAAGVALEPRGNTALELSEMDEEGRIAIDVGPQPGPGARLVLSPADDALLVPVPAHRTGVPAGASQWPADAGGEVWRPAYQRGRTLDGDDEAARAVCLALAAALEGSDADLELVLVDDDGAERELSLSAWLRELADLPSLGRLPPHASARDAFADVVDALLDER